MTLIRDDAKEAVEEQFAIYETERIEMLDEIAELKQENETLRLQVTQLMTDRSMVVS